MLFESFTNSINIGDNTNIGIVSDKTDTQYEIDSTWYHHSIVKPSTIVKKQVLHNRGRISPDMIISAFANPIDQEKAERYARDMEDEMMENEFPPIKGFPIKITDGDLERFGEFLSGEPITEDDLGKYAWVTTDGHHRTIAALQANLPFLRTKLDTVYMADETDYTE